MKSFMNLFLTSITIRYISLRYFYGDPSDPSDPAG